MIGDIRARHPDVIFLSEAFTRPKVTYRLAKIGFSQSYTYFTWRNERWELEQYMSELTTSEAREFFRPHFFVNTHDINPDFLQNAPRPAYVIHALRLPQRSPVSGASITASSFAKGAPTPSARNMPTAKNTKSAPGTTTARAISRRKSPCLTGSAGTISRCNRISA